MAGPQFYKTDKESAMRFKHNGQEYRLVFRHDPSRDLSAHVGHKIFIGKRTIDGTALVACDDCSEPSSTTFALTLHPLNKAQRRRSTHLEIQIRGSVNGKESWREFISTTSKLNVKAGDTFKKSAGREAALVLAVGDVEYAASDRKSFAYAAWRAYFSRKKAQRLLLEGLGL